MNAVEKKIEDLTRSLVATHELSYRLLELRREDLGSVQILPLVQH